MEMDRAVKSESAAAAHLNGDFDKTAYEPNVFMGEKYSLHSPTKDGTVKRNTASTVASSLPPLPSPPPPSGSKMVERYLHDLDVIISKRKHMLSDHRNRGGLASGGALSLHKKKVRRTDVSEAMDHSNDETFLRRVLHPDELDGVSSSHQELSNAISQGSPQYSPLNTPPASKAKACSDLEATNNSSFEIAADINDPMERSATEFGSYSFHIGSNQTPPRSDGIKNNDLEKNGTDGNEIDASFSDMQTEDLLHHLRVAEAKNQLLKLKVMEMEGLLEASYLEHSEKAKLLSKETNRLESQRAELEEDLVTTKEELLFIRAQLQNKSARISELEFDLLAAQRRTDDVGEELVEGSASSFEKNVVVLVPQNKHRASELDGEVEATTASYENEYHEMVQENLLLAHYVEEASREKAAFVSTIDELNHRQIETDRQLFEAEMRLAELELQLLSARNSPAAKSIGLITETCNTSAAAGNEGDEISFIATTTATTVTAPNTSQQGDAICMLISILSLQIVLWVLVLLIAALYFALLDRYDPRHLMQSDAVRISTDSISQELLGASALAADFSCGNIFVELFLQLASSIGLPVAAGAAGSSTCLFRGENIGWFQHPLDSYRITS